MSAKTGLRRTALGFVGQAPATQTKFACARRLPFQLPISHSLFAVEILAGSDKFISHTRAQRLGKLDAAASGAGINTGHLKFSGDDRRKRIHRRPQVPQKGVPRREQARWQICFDGFRSPVRVAPPAIQPDGMKLPKNPELRIFSTARTSCGDRQEASAPLRQNGSNLVVIFLGDEVVQARLRLEQRGLDRQLGAIVRTQMEFATGEDAFGESGSVGERKSQTAQTRRNERRGGSLAAPDQKVAAAGVRRINDRGEDRPDAASSLPDSD